MGPRPLGRGRRRQLCTGTPITRASMGPRPFGRGGRTLAEAGLRPGASMGPRPFGRGRRPDGRRPEGRRPASMGPRPFGRGRRLKCTAQPSVAVDGFNGATAFQPWKTSAALEVGRLLLVLQWGHGLSAVEDGSDAPRWHLGRCRRLQWGHGHSTVEDGRAPRAGAAGPGGFNGATAFRPWKTTAIGVGATSADAASMGPRPFGRGRQPTTRQYDCQLDELQWGHGQSAVEDEVGGSNPLGPIAASMGPRPFDRGRRGAFCSAIDPVQASMGPRPFDRGRRRDRQPRRYRSPGFNGATAIRPWKTRIRQLMSESPLMLQWGHGLSVVED